MHAHYTHCTGTFVTKCPHDRSLRAEDVMLCAGKVKKVEVCTNPAVTGPEDIIWLCCCGSGKHTDAWPSMTEPHRC